MRTLVTGSTAWAALLLGLFCLFVTQGGVAAGTSEVDGLVERCRAASRSANLDDALGHCNLALDALEQHQAMSEARALTLQARGRLLARKGVYEPAIADLRQSAALAQKTQDADTRAASELLLARCLRLSGSPSQAYVPLLSALRYLSVQVSRSVPIANVEADNKNNPRDSRRIALLRAYADGLSEKAQLCLANKDGQCAAASAESACELQHRADTIACGTETDRAACARISRDLCLGEAAAVLARIGGHPDTSEPGDTPAKK